MFYPFFLILTFLILPNSAAPPPNRALTCPVKLPYPPSSPARIIGGVFPLPETLSRIVSFPDFRCGGTLISPTWAVTAAHCDISVSSEAFIGGTSSTNGQPLSVKAVHKHPDSERFVHDIALVQFEQPVSSSSKFMAINTNPDIPAVGEYARTVGYGYTHENGANMDNDFLMRQVDLPVVSTEICKQDIMLVDDKLGRDITSNAHLCAGYDTGNCDTCLGDSGGPLFAYGDGDQLIQIGIVSFGHGCARPGIPGGYTRISAYVDWMKSVGAEFTTASTRNAVFLDGANGDVPASPTSPAPVSNPDEPVAPGTDNGSGNDSKPDGGSNDKPIVPPAENDPNTDGGTTDEEDSASDNTGLIPSITPDVLSNDDPDGSSSTGLSTGDDDGGSSSIGPIIGGVIGGLAILVAVLTLIFVYYRRGATTVGTAAETAESGV